VDTANTEVPPRAAGAVTALYAQHTLGLVRLAVIMLGEQCSPMCDNVMGFLDYSATTGKLGRAIAAAPGDSRQHRVVNRN
jgi:hypothetical protein